MLVEREINKTVRRGRELAQLHPTLSENAGCLEVHEVALVVHNFTDADLRNLDTACQAWAGIAVQDSRLADAISSSFEERVFFGVEA